LSRDCKEKSDDVVHRNAIGEAEENPKMTDIETSQADRVTMEEDDIHEIGEEEKEKLNDVDYLTGNPLPNDILLYAVPVCAPYSALQSYKYRVKIIPGPAKKGKVYYYYYYYYLFLLYIYIYIYIYIYCFCYLVSWTSSTL